MVPAPSSFQELSLVAFVMKALRILPCLKFLALAVVGASTIELPGIVFGCIRNEGAPNPALLEVPGLGGGPLSLVNQIGSSIERNLLTVFFPKAMKTIPWDSSNSARTRVFRQEVQETLMAPGSSQSD
uniref:Uncharacterized protein n=1 Tax=Nymphaea colorata TaxID=210225 RepID=A0A5K1DMC3_9MAGN